VGAKARPHTEAAVISGDDGELAVAVSDVVDLTDVIPEEDRRGPGQALGVGLIIRNVGAQRYADNITYGAYLIAGDGKQLEASNLGAGGPLLGHVTLPPNSTRNGYLVFEVDAEYFTPAVLQLSLDAGYGETMAEWDVRPLTGALVSSAGPRQIDISDSPSRATPDREPVEPEEHGTHERHAATQQDRIDINLASEADLAALPGVGAVLAKRAVVAREAGNGFASVEAFIEVLDIKPHIAGRIIDVVKLTPPKSSEPERPTGRVVDY
jgi:DNA uptake protein ComE-like DNA-binding protein